jgi:hypothetical protein
MPRGDSAATALLRQRVASSECCGLHAFAAMELAVAGFRGESGACVIRANAQPQRRKSEHSTLPCCLLVLVSYRPLARAYLSTGHAHDTYFTRGGWVSYAWGPRVPPGRKTRAREERT